MIVIAALMNMLGDNEIILDEADVNLAIKALQHKQMIVTQSDTDRTITIRLEET